MLYKGLTLDDVVGLQSHTSIWAGETGKQYLFHCNVLELSAQCVFLHKHPIAQSRTVTPTPRTEPPSGSPTTSEYSGEAETLVM